MECLPTLSLHSDLVNAREKIELGVDAFATPFRVIVLVLVDIVLLLLIYDTREHYKWSMDYTK